MEKVLIIEDEQPLARFLELELQHEGYRVEVCHDGLDGLNKALAEDYDAILLDILLPNMNGLDICKSIREAKNTSIIMITARNAVWDKVRGLDFGADDYMTKPFAIEELLARLRSLKRRSAPAASAGKRIYRIADLILDSATHLVYRANIPITLSTREFELLHYLLERQNVVVSRDQCLQDVWGYDFSGGTNVVDVYIRYLRAKIDDPFPSRLIHTIRGFGYVIRQA